MRRLGVLALLVAAASVVVAIGATGVGLLLPPTNLNSRWALAVRIAGAAAVIAGSAGLLLQRKRLRSNANRRYDPTVAGLATAAAIMGALALMARLAPAPDVVNGPVEADMTSTHDVAVEDETEPTTDSAGTTAGGIIGGLGLVRAGRDRRVPQEGEDQGEEAADRSMLRRAGGFILLAVLLAVAVFGVLALKDRIRHGRQREDPPPDSEIAAPDAEEALKASLTDVAYDGPDPRRQITTAYQRLLAALAAAGAPRQPQEAPHEHLHRTLGPLGVRAEPMHSLTELYVVAQFSERPINDQHRAAATGALEAGLDSLRATNDEPEAAGRTDLALGGSTPGEAAPGRSGA